MIFAVLDDEKEVCLSLVDIFQREGLYGVYFTDPELFLKYDQIGSVDCVFIDVNLGGKVNGIDVLRRLNAEYPLIEKVIISGNSDIKTAVEALKYGAYDFVEKPLLLGVILKIIKNVVEKKSLNKHRSELIDDVLKSYPLIGESEQLRQVKLLIKKFASLNEPVLITGESGTGKEAVAARIHYYSGREAFNRINIASLQPSLIESELFGYKKGSFSGALSDRKGIIESTDQGSLFLDEIGEMDISLQAKILRIVQEKEYMPVGDVNMRKANVRYIFATNRNLHKKIVDGGFREDLFYRISALTVDMPPLRERREDIPLLVKYFLNQFAQEYNQSVKIMTKEAEYMLLSYNYPGNIRELKNAVIRSAAVSGDRGIIEAEDIVLSKIQSERQEHLSLFMETLPLSSKKKQLETVYITTQLKKYNWDLQRVADKLDLLLPNLYRKLKELDIDLDNKV